MEPHLEQKDILEKAILQSFESVVQHVIEKRAQEGEILKNFLYSHLNDLGKQLTLLNNELPMLKKKIQQRIRDTFQNFNLKVDTGKFEQELVFALQKVDVAEEIERLVIHSSECKKQLTESTVKGAQLDFLMQELIRESNSLSAKIGEATLNLKVVDMKVLIEEMREQIQNIE